jgi:hypothetical protein
VFDYQQRPTTEAYRSGWDKIFRDQKEDEAESEDEKDSGEQAWGVAFTKWLNESRKQGQI